MAWNESTLVKTTSTTLKELAAVWYIQVRGTPIPDNRIPVQGLSTSTELKDDEGHVNYNTRPMAFIWMVQQRQFFYKIQKKICRQPRYSTQSAKNGVGAPLIQVVIFPGQSPSFNYTIYSNMLTPWQTKKGKWLISKA